MLEVHIPASSLALVADWLTFWFVYSVAAFAKSILDYVSVIIPFYEEAYIGFLIFLGFLGGADMIYAQVLRPFLKENEALIDAKCVCCRFERIFT